MFLTLTLPWTGIHMHTFISVTAHHVRLDWRRPWGDPVPVLFNSLAGNLKMSLRDLESIFREEETGEQIAIAALVQRPVLLSRGQVGVTAALLRWAMLPQLPGKIS